MIITITLNAALDRTQRIEHPLQVGKLNRAVSSHLEPGGKGINVSRAIKALGGSSIALGFSAGTNGRIMKDMLTAADIHHDFVDIAGQLRVNTQIIDAQGGHTEVNEPGNKLDDSDFLRLLDRMENYLDEGNIFVLSGSTPPEFPLKNYRKLCKTIKKHGCKLIIDAQGELLRLSATSRLPIPRSLYIPHARCWIWAQRLSAFPWVRRALCSPQRTSRSRCTLPPTRKSTTKVRSVPAMQWSARLQTLCTRA